MAARRFAKPGSILVATKPIPRFRVLSDISRGLDQNVDRLLQEVNRQITRVLRNVQEDPAEIALVEAARLAVDQGVPPERLGLLARSAMLTPLRKTPGAPGLFDSEDRDITKPEIRGLTQVAFTLRELYGAPLGPGGLVDLPDSRKAILAMMPFLGGVMHPDRGQAKRTAGRVKSEERVVSLIETFHLDQSIRSTVMRRVISGELVENVEVVLHPPIPGHDPVYTVRKGSATVMLSRWLGLPALRMLVFLPTEPTDVERIAPTMQTVTDFEEVDRFMPSQLHAFQYRVPPALEPIAELARRLELREFVDAFEGRPSQEEIDRRHQADLVNSSRESVWMMLYGAARHAGLNQDTSLRRADASAEFRRLTSAWRPRERAARKGEAEGHELREGFRRRKALSVQIADELTLPLGGPRVGDAHSLWFEARAGMEDFPGEVLLGPAEPEQEPEKERPTERQSTPRHPNLHEFDAWPGSFRREAERAFHEVHQVTELDPSVVDTPFHSELSSPNREDIHIVEGEPKPEDGGIFPSKPTPARLHVTG